MNQSTFPCHVSRGKRPESGMFHPEAFICALLLLFNNFFFSSGTKNSNPDIEYKEHILSDAEWPSIEDIDVSGEQNDRTRDDGTLRGVTPGEWCYYLWSQHQHQLICSSVHQIICSSVHHQYHLIFSSVYHQPQLICSSVHHQHHFIC